MNKQSRVYGFILVMMTTALYAFTTVHQQLTVWMIGDSTMAIKTDAAWPETGWGVPFAKFFDNTVEVRNLAKNGRSTKSFRAEGLWKPVMEQMHPGDYVLIQFGHNDEVPTKATATTESQFEANLRQYVQETRDKKGLPVLLTSVARRKFNGAGMLEDTHEVYNGIVRRVAADMQVPLIEHDKSSMALLRQLGPDATKLLYLHLQPGDNPNHPKGKADDTHFSELGARLMAQLVLQEVRTKLPLLAEKIIKR